MENNFWGQESDETITSVKHLLSHLSIKVRTHQFKIFQKMYSPTSKTKILDVGVSASEELSDSNMFEKLYKWHSQLTCATIEDPKKIKKLYPKTHVVKITPHKKLPFKDNQFDIVVSWATLEHVGSYEDQKFFLKELSRVGKNIFVTTPYRGSIYEPHTGLFFAQWLPLSWFRKICKMVNQKYWSTSDNLNPLYVNDLKKMDENNNLKIKVYKLFGFLPSHLIISSKSWKRGL